MRISYIFLAIGLLVLAACGGEDKPQDTATNDAPETTTRTEAETPDSTRTNPPAPIETASTEDADRFIPGVIKGLSVEACAAMGGIEGRSEFRGKTTHYCQMNGYGTSYQCGDDLIITIGGKPGDFRMHVSGEDAFYPITLQREGSEASWAGAHGALSFQIEGNAETGHAFKRNDTQTACQLYVHD